LKGNGATTYAALGWDSVADLHRHRVAAV